MKQELEVAAKNEKAEAILAIAREHLLHDPAGTLETRNSDSLDFHEVGVAGIKAALAAAYAAGYDAAKKDTNDHG